MVESLRFDVFLAHNSVDKPLVRTIAKALKKRGLKPWLDEEQILLGDSIPRKVTQGLTQCPVALFFIGTSGFGKFQEFWEFEALIMLCYQKNVRIIPVLLPGVNTFPEELALLSGKRYLQLPESIETKLLDELVQSINDTRLNATRQTQDVLLPPSEVPSGTFIQVEESQATLPAEPELRSERGVDYRQLRQFLAEGKWEEADQETANVMLQAANQESKGYLDDNDIDNFPCEDLRTINQLWLHYSKGKFGFSVQAEIYRSLGGTREYNEKVWEKFWRTCRLAQWRRGFSRVKTCNL